MEQGGDEEAGGTGSCSAEPGSGRMGMGMGRRTRASLPMERRGSQTGTMVPLGLSSSSPTGGCQSQEAQPM